LGKSLDDGSLPFDTDKFIIGDQAYPLKTQMMRRFAGDNLSTEQRIFNEALDAGRVVVERAYGRMKQMWRILWFSHSVIELKSRVVIFCCILHNLTIWGRHFDLEMLYGDEYDLEEVQTISSLSQNPQCGETTAAGETRRHQLMRSLVE
jgi:hypothetical protein